MKESKSEKQISTHEESGSRSVGKQVALKDFSVRRRGEVYIAVKKGDDCSKLDDARKALLKSNGVI